MNPSTPDYYIGAYDYELPERLIAQRPAQPRDGSRLLVIDRAKGGWEHRVFRDLPEYFGREDVLVANNTRVIRARLLGRRLIQGPDGQWAPSGKAEFLMLERAEGGGSLRWKGLFKAAARYLPGLRFQVPTPDGRGLVGTLVVGSYGSPGGTVVAEFDRDPLACGAGELPLPHYISRAGDASKLAPLDEESYQTQYAKQPGSAAAPTAGLHFTPAVLDRLRARGASWEEVTLDVGLGTFRPVKSDDIREHLMHDERYEIAPDVAARVTEAKRQGKRVTAVGTTSVRTLESAWRGESIRAGGHLAAGSSRTSIFIYPGAPGFQGFKVVDRLLTNFHLPKSTLLMLVSAFAGRELVLAAYREAVREEYRFFSYGDAMLIL
jgi:S-adenosylmethionine:tRNA ribosyltransferase-isomerase